VLVVEVLRYALVEIPSLADISIYEVSAHLDGQHDLEVAASKIYDTFLDGTHSA
jgi:hypothetical protein